MKVNEEKHDTNSLLLHDLTDEKIDDNLDFIEQEFLLIDLVDEEQELLKLAEDKIIDPQEITRLIQEIRYSPNINNQGLDLSKTNTALNPVAVIIEAITILCSLIIINFMFGSLFVNCYANPTCEEQMLIDANEAGQKRRDMIEKQLEAGMNIIKIEFQKVLPEVMTNFKAQFLAAIETSVSHFPIDIQTAIQPSVPSAFQRAIIFFETNIQAEVNKATEAAIRESFETTINPNISVKVDEAVAKASFIVSETAFISVMTEIELAVETFIADDRIEALSALIGELPTSIVLVCNRQVQAAPAA